MTNIRFSVEGIELLNTTLVSLRHSIENLHIPFADVREEFQRIQMQWFESQGRGSWSPLSPGYALWKSINFPGRPLLVLSGDLKDALELDFLEQNYTLDVITEPPYYWFFHQYGTSKMPARPPFVIDDETQKLMAQKLSDAVSKAIKNAG